MSDDAKKHEKQAARLKQQMMRAYRRRDLDKALELGLAADHEIALATLARGEAFKLAAREA
jgi:hypothetical protein